jgi:integrase
MSGESDDDESGAVKALSKTNEMLREQLDKKDEEIKKLTEEVEKLRKQREEDDKLPDPPSNDEIVEGYLRWKYGTKEAHPNEKSVFRRIRDYTDDKPLRELTEEDVRGWIETLDTKATTNYNYITRIKKLFDWMTEEEWGMEENPIEDYRRRYRDMHTQEISRTGKNAGTVLKPSEFARLLGSIYNKRARAILVLGAKTGLRRKQLCYLERDDVDVDDNIILDRYPKGTGENRLDDDRADRHPIDDETAYVLSKWLRKRDDENPDNEWLFPGRYEGEHISPSRLTGAMEELTSRAATVQRNEGEDELAEKFEEFSTHDLRRCFTTWLNQNGCPRDIISDLRADGDPDMVGHYTQYEPEEIREEYENAIPKFGLQG